MKIFICEGNFSAGGAERVVCNLANYLVEKNDVMVVALTKTNMAYDMDENIKCASIDKKTYNSSSSLISKVLNKLTKNIYRLLKLNKMIREYSPDLIVSFLPEPSMLTLLLKKFHKVPTIISVRNDPKIEYASKLYYCIMKLTYPKADGVVFQTEEARDYFDGILKCSTTIIPNPINPEFSVKPFGGEKNKKIVSIGRLSEQKNQKVLIDAFSKISNDFPDYELVIYGDGELRSDLENQIKKLGLEKKIKLPGVKKNIKEEIYEASLFVLPSLYEGMPNALMEAMALGLPVISTDCPCGGPAFLIENNVNGVLVKVNDVIELENAMRKVLSNSDFATKIGKNANKINKTLAPDIINNQWYEYIKKIYNETK